MAENRIPEAPPENLTPREQEFIASHQLASQPDSAPTREQVLEERLHPHRDLPASTTDAQQRFDQQRHDERLRQHEEQVRRDIPSSSRSRKPINRRNLFLWVGLALLLLFLIFLVGFLPRHSRNKQIDQEAETRRTADPVIQVVQVRRSRTPDVLTIPGTTTPITEAYIYARANGYLKRRFVDIGDHVRKGQLLALIDSPELDQQVEQARAQLHQAESQLGQQNAQLDLTKVTWQRWEVLAAKGVFARQDADQKETDYKAAIANVAAAQRNIESFRANLRRAIDLQQYERVTAPFDGVITARNVDVGALINTGGSGLGTSSSDAGGSTSGASSNTGGSSGGGTSVASPSTGQSQGGLLFAMAQTNRLRILVSVPEGYASSVHPGQAAELRMQEYPKQPFHGTVARIANSIDQNTRTMLTEVDIDNKDGRLIPGMYTVVNFIQLQAQAPLTIPGSAIAIRQDRTMVASVQNNTVHFQPVEIGRDFGAAVEIVNGIKDGDYLATDITDQVREGGRIQPKLSNGPGENNGGASAQTSKTPDGNARNGDQSITSQQTEDTTQHGKKSDPGSAGGSSNAKGGSDKKQ